MDGKVKEIEKLALDISSCQEIDLALAGNHPCSDVVSWQVQEWDLHISKVESTPLHRPEAWTGDLSEAPIVFLASNPSFNHEENYPDWSGKWSEKEITQFASKRFIAEGERSFGAIDKGLNRDKTYLKDGKPSKNSVAYWREIRGRVAEILNKEVNEVSAHSDFVMTELVHCKSFKEIGVSNALVHCTKKYMERIFNLSPATIVIVMGKKPAEQLVKLYREIPTNWGSWKDSETKAQRGYWPKKNEIETAISEGRWTPEEQMKHTAEIVIGGKLRKVIWLPRPNSSLPRTLSEPLISTEVMNYWRSNL
jgi:hypothetical protein